MQAYCFKCREERVIQEAEAVVMKNGRHGFRGKCPECGRKLFRVVQSSEVR